MAKQQTGWGCLKPDAEILTPSGWKRISEMAETEIIMQWNRGDILDWCEAKKFETDFDGELVVYDSWFHKQAYTPEHRIPAFNYDTKKFFETTAIKSLDLKAWSLPLGAYFKAGTKSLSFIKLMVMIQADGCIEKDAAIRISFTKQKKIDRCIQLLTENNLPIIEHSAKPGYKRFYISAEHSKSIILELQGNKTFRWSLLELKQEDLRAFIDEIKYWDSTIRGNSFIYYTTNEENSNIVSTIAHLVGYSSTTRVELNNNAGYGSGNNKPLYSVAIKCKMTCLNLQGLNVSREKYSGKVYCVTTKSSYFLVRYKNVISITGNTNMQNWDKHLRECVIAPPGYVLFNIDQGGADALIVAYLCKLGRFRSLFLNKIKPHTYVAMRIATPHWASLLGLPDIEEYCQSPIAELKKLKYWSDLSTLIADSDNDPNPQKRFYYIGKTCCHLLNYDAQWQQFQMTALVKSEGSLAFTDTQAKFYRNLYRDTLFPELTDWHCDVIRQLDSNNRVLKNLFGHPRKFHESWGRELFKQAYAFIPQSTVSIIILLAQTEITARMDSGETLLKHTSILQNGHDALLGMCLESEWQQVITSLAPHISRDLMSPRGEPFKMGVGIKIGKNWGEFDPKNPDKNPNGLMDPEMWLKLRGN